MTTQLIPTQAVRLKPGERFQFEGDDTVYTVYYSNINSAAPVFMFTSPDGTPGQINLSYYTMVLKYVTPGPAKKGCCD